MMQSEFNPYASPASVDAPPAAAPHEAQARRDVRMAVAVLFLPAAGNGVLLAMGAGSFLVPAAVANVMLVVAVAAGLWWLGLAALNRVGLMLHALFGGATSREAWLARMHESLWPLPWAAGAGAAIWGVWLGLFFGPYYLSLPATIVLGTLGHVAAAWVYLTIFAGWRRLRREPR